MFSKNVPTTYWSNVVLIVDYLINNMPSKTLDSKVLVNLRKSFLPHVNLSGSLPLKIFGCVAFVYVHNRERSKLDPRALNAFSWVIHIPKKALVLSPSDQESLSLNGF